MVEQSSAIVLKPIMGANCYGQKATAVPERGRVSAAAGGGFGIGAVRRNSIDGVTGAIVV